MSTQKTQTHNTEGTPETAEKVLVADFSNITETTQDVEKILEEKPEKKNKKRLGVSLKRLGISFIHVDIERMWLACIFGGGLVVIFFLVYGWVIFLQVAGFEERVLAEERGGNVADVQLEEIARVRAEYEEQEQVFEELKQNPPRIRELR